jgi:ssDNA-specific exonuclease RecJ
MHSLYDGAVSHRPPASTNTTHHSRAQDPSGNKAVLIEPPWKVQAWWQMLQEMTFTRLYLDFDD